MNPASSRKRPGGVVRLGWTVGAASAAVLVAGAGLCLYLTRGGRTNDPRLAVAERRTFAQVIRRRGVLQPARKQPIFPKVNGHLQRVIGDGAQVQEKDELFQMDPKEFEDDLTEQLANLRRLKADWERDRQNLAKDLRKAQDEVEGRALRVELESTRLKEMVDGPTAADELNAKTAVENAKNLAEARREEWQVFAELARDGYVSQADARQKELASSDQALKVVEAELAYRKLHEPDAVKLAEQRLKVRDEEKNRDAARERTDLLKRNLERATERFQMQLRRGEKQRDDAQEKITNCRYLAPNPGIVLHRMGGRRGWGALGPGREVWEGAEIMTLSDLRKMKAVLTVDEGRITWVCKDQPARVRMPGGAVLEGVVGRVAEKGHDEFENLAGETQDLTGKANRQVFDVEVEIAGVTTDLRPGQWAEVEILVRELPDVLVIPRSALLKTSATEGQVYVPDGRNVVARPVKVLAEDALNAAVEGVEEGARVWRIKP